ncbi:hypothetical protein LY28_03673 [Ruminiclostridium sufflavum DSM 19573]|uniref:Uncharacterized protein n=1 Tax=Ruminiclostridium sufflavum DSM 19573 TaxID=1121337 RepID=A0A318XH67_9FIRM|nr:DUF5979 domain-containing protein [Ruminiclostridium sufflavum]PYG84309.1 hypothetical protein LY28_03673 [Ruminiclostridium sufflavum DSM 19573]
MIKRKRQKITAWVLLLTILFGALSPMNEALSAKPSSLDADVSVTGINEGGTIDGSTDIGITVAFNVPVEGDGGLDYFQYGDEVELLLSTSFHFDPVPTDSIELMYKEKKLGTVTLLNNAEGQAMANIKFDGDEYVFDPDKLQDGETAYSGVSGMFKATLKYNGNHDTDIDGKKTVSILEKKYKLQLPGDKIIYSVEKKAEGSAVNIDEGTITWTVAISAEKDTAPVPTPIDLAGYVFEDDLNGIGEYVGNSFSLSGGTVSEADLATPDAGSTKLTYSFPAGSVSPQTLTFKTKIPNTILTAGGSITNTAGLYLDNKRVDFDDFTATISKPYATKWGETDDDISGTTYDTTGRSIIWYIKVENEGRTLNDLTITDELKGGLSLDSAQWQRWNATDSKWEDVPGISWTTVPPSNKYKIGEKTGGGVNYTGRLKLVTKVPDSIDGSVVATKYNNQADVSWSGSDGTTGSTSTGSFEVGIGYNAISKNGTQSAEDIKKHQITWTLDVDMKGQTAENFKVYDLFVHDAETSDSDITNALDWPDGLSLGSDGITRNNGQKFVEVSSKEGHLTVNSINLQKEGKIIATLVEIKGLRNSGSNQAVLKSQVIDPDILAGNDQNQKVYNYAALYKGNDYRGNAGTYVNYNNKVLAKELLNRAEADNDHTAGTGGINADNRTTNAADGFHYGYKEAIFRLNINASGIDFANVETNLTEGFGDVAVTDTLPEGWEFAKFSEGQDYLIYEAAEALNTGNGYPATGSLTTSGGALDSVPGLTAAFDRVSSTQTATFTFKNLNKPYVVLVKARPSDTTLDSYLKGNATRNETNTLSISSEKWQPGKNVSQLLEVKSKVLDKTLDLSKQNQGILTWLVEYTPFGREIGTGIEDTLPQGIDLRTDSSGQLIWEQDGSRNISIRELTLKDDGSGTYKEGPELAADVLKSVIGYDNSARKLTFNFPDSARAYKLTYVTDITGTPENVTNAVKLVAADGNGPSTNKAFAITEQQGMATMGRSGYLIVKKKDINSAFLPGAEFTLYNTDKDGSRASSRAVRTTGSDGTVKFYGLAPGNYILVETKSPDEYENPPMEYNVAVSSELKTTVNGSGIITGSAPFYVVNYKATDPVGSLTISKAVTGNGADTEKAFDFTLTLSGAAGVYSYTGHGVSGGSIASGDSFSLANGQSITITGLPAGARYTVTEADYSGAGYTTTSTGADGDILTNTTQTAAFTNTRTAGNLVIAKTVAGNAGDRSKSFDFMLTLNGAMDIPYAYSGNGVLDGTIKSGDSFSLANGQSITITGLPAGAGYTVTESDYSGEGYTTVSTGADGIIETDATQTAAFTNTKNVWSPSPGTGDLTISKTVTGTNADTTRKFNFTVTLNGAYGSYNYTGNGIANGKIKTGDAVSLANGQSITITGLPAGTRYTVTESDYSGDGYTTVSTGADGGIKTGTTQTAAFTNTKNNWYPSPDTGNLTISKTVSGEKADTNRKFNFTLSLSGVYDSYDYTGNGVPNGTIKSGGIISLAHGQSITITGLPEGTRYTVAESDYSGDGYTAASTGADGNIVTGTTQTAAFTNHYGDSEIIPEEPEAPAGSTGNSGNTGNGGGNSPQGSTGSEKPHKGSNQNGMPHTGDNQTGDLAKLGVLFFSAVLLALITADFVLRKKNSGHRRLK